MKNITVVDGHPDPSRSRLTHALVDRYVEKAKATGLKVRRIDIARIEYPVLRSTSEFYNTPTPEPLRQAQADIAWADHIVFFYPLWHGNMPALLKAFIEQIFRPGFAVAYGGKQRFPKPLFKGKSAHVVVTMGMPAFVYRAFFGAYGVKSFERSVLAFCGISPITQTLLGGAGGNCACRVRKWLDGMPALAERDAHPQEWRRRTLLRRVLGVFALLGASYAAYVLSASKGTAWLHESPHALS
jgi:putative NADPH-quinone reductase